MIFFVLLSNLFMVLTIKLIDGKPLTKKSIKGVWLDIS